MAIDIFLLVASLLAILLAAELFTNSVEWLGRHLGLNEGAVGSILAAVGTAMPETMIPIIAILFAGGADSEEIGIGAILGAPFMLSTAAFFVTGTAVILFARSGRRPPEMSVNTEILRRDMGYFLVVYAAAILATLLPHGGYKHGVAFLLLGLYLVYAYRTLATEGEMEETLNPLHFGRALRIQANEPPVLLTAIQFAVALAMIIGGARVFVSSLENVAHTLGAPPLVLALILAPLATELPEKFNSVLWVREGKDTLAMGNISGAMVFQSCIPVAIGVSFTPWELSQPALVSASIAIVSTGIVYLSLRRRGVLSPAVLARAGILYVAFVLYVVLR